MMDARFSDCSKSSEKSTRLAMTETEPQAGSILLCLCKVRRGWSRFSQGAQEHGTLSVPAACGVLDMPLPEVAVGMCTWNFQTGKSMETAGQVAVVELLSFRQLLSASPVLLTPPRLGHTCSFFYYLGAVYIESQPVTKSSATGDNLLWAASVGLVRSKEVPQMQRRLVGRS